MCVCEGVCVCLGCSAVGFVYILGFIFSSTSNAAAKQFSPFSYLFGIGQSIFFLFTLHCKLFHLII